MERKHIEQSLNEDISLNLEGDPTEVIAFLNGIPKMYPGYMSYRIAHFQGYESSAFELYGTRQESDTEYNKRLAIKKKKDLAKLKREAKQNKVILTEVEKFRVKYSLPENISLEELKTELNKLSH
jgi:hypothetical protein